MNSVKKTFNYRDYKLACIRFFSKNIDEQDIFSRTKISWYINLIRLFDNYDIKAIIKYRDGSKKACTTKCSHGRAENILFMEDNEIHIDDENNRIFMYSDLYLAEYRMI